MSDWRNELSNYFDKTETEEVKENKSDLENFIIDVVIPAFQNISVELEARWRKTTIRQSETSASLAVHKDGEEEMTYRIQGRTFPTGVLPYAEIRSHQRNGHKLVTIESMFRSGSEPYAISDITADEIIQHFVKNYTSRV